MSIRCLGIRHDNSDIVFAHFEGTVLNFGSHRGPAERQTQPFPALLTRERGNPGTLRVSSATSVHLLSEWPHTSGNSPSAG